MWTATVDFTKASDSISRKSVWEALKSCNVYHEYVSFLRKFYRDQNASVQTDEESKIFDIQKGSKQGDPMSSLLFNTVLQYSLKDEIQRWQKKKEWEYTWATMTATASRTWDLPTTWSCLQPPKNRYGKWCMNSRRQPREWDSGFTQTRRRFSATRAPSIRTQKDILKSVTWASKCWQDMKAWNIWARESRSTNKRHWKSRAGSEQLGRPSTNADKCWRQKTTCSNIVYDFSTPQFLRLSATQQEHGHRTRTTKEWFNRRNARCYDSLSRQKKFKKNEKQDIEPKEEKGNVDITEICSIDDESDDGQSTKSKDDVDSEVTFEEDSYEEMDTIEIEEED